MQYNLKYDIIFIVIIKEGVTIKTLKRFIAYYKPFKLLFTIDMVCAFIVAAADLFFPLITKNMINDYIPNAKIKMVFILGGALLALYIVKSLLNYVILYWGHLLGVRIQANMRRDVFTHLQKLPFSYFDENKTGTIMSRIVNDLMDISELAHHGPEDIFLSVIMLIGAFIVLAGISLPLTLIIFAFIPFLVFFAARKRIKMSDAFTKTRVEVAEVNANLENSISGIRVSKAFVNTDFELKKFQKGNLSFQKAREIAYKTMAEFFSGTSFILDILNVVVFLAGGLFFYFGKINIGDFTAFILFVNMFLNPIKRLINFVEQYQSGITGFRRFVDIMDSEKEKDAENATHISDVSGVIDFKNVTFSYDEKKNVLSDLNLHIESGKTIALVGPSGGGKTTLCHLLPRFYDIDEGEIFLDGKNIKDITLRSLRENIGIVQQDVFLFTGTIYENILYGNVNATFEEVVEAAKKANIHDYIMGLEDGYDTYIGERGIKLSGGQKQRISIARVFLKNPPVLILDEATSALDNATEVMIQQSLESLCKGRTTLVVAHRLSTIKNADEILVLTDDGIAERGTHDFLLEKNGLYAKLYNMTLR